MKVKKTVLYIFMFFPLIITLIALPFLPDQIPAHYDIDNQVTRWGSKYESLILPLFSIAFGFFMLGMAKICAKVEKTGKNNENICIIIGIISLALYNAMTGYFLYTAYNEIENLSSVQLDVNQLVFVVLGISYIIIGNIMPKLRMNSCIGLRTGWSMKNEAVWKKSQRFGGASLMIAGAVTVLVCCFVKGLVCTALSLGILLACIIVDIIYTYKAAKKYSTSDSGT
ncbi:MAG TPA: hypothetical protein DDX91_09485 [Ruminococcaceae bacterium]|nr:hypothetical protein [Oscillospiraceae bacterium]